MSTENLAAVMANLCEMEQILEKAPVSVTWLLTLVRSAKTNLRAHGGIPT